MSGRKREKIEVVRSGGGGDGGGSSGEEWRVTRATAMGDRARSARALHRMSS